MLLINSQTFLGKGRKEHGEFRVLELWHLRRNINAEEICLQPIIMILMMNMIN